MPVCLAQFDADEVSTPFRSHSPFDFLSGSDGAVRQIIAVGTVTAAEARVADAWLCRLGLIAVAPGDKYG